MDKMLLLLLTILGVLVFSWIFQAVRLYKSSKGDIYSALYGSFLPYFYRYVVIRDCSESGYLRSRIGTHKIVFSVISGEEGQKAKFCVIFYARGIMVLCYDKATGEFRGSSSGKSWNVVRRDAQGKDHIFRHHNPTEDMKAYLRRLAQVFPEVHMEARLAFSDEADLSMLHTDIRTIHFGELEEELKGVQGDLLSDDEVRGLYKKLIGK